MNIHSQKGIAPVAIVLIVVAVLAVAGVGFAFVIQPMLQGGGDPETRLNKAFERLMAESSADVSVEMHIVGGIEEGEEPEADLDVLVAIAGAPLPGNKDESVRTEGMLNIEGQIEGESIQAEIDFRSLPPKTFVRLTSAVIPDMGEAQPILDSALNRWVYMEAGEDSEMNEIMEDMSPVSLPSDCDPTEEQKDAVEAYVKSLVVTDFVTNVQAGAREELPPNGDKDRAVIRYSMTPDVEAMAQIGARIEELSGCEVEDGDEESETEVKKLEMLVGEQTGLLRGVDLEVAAEDETNVTASIWFINFGSKPDVEEPEGAVSFEELMNQMMEDLMGDMMGDLMLDAGADLEVGGDAMIDLSELPTQEEIDALFEGTGMEYNLP